MPDEREGTGLRAHLLSVRRPEGRFFISSNNSESCEPAIFSRKVSIWISPRAAVQRLPVLPISVCGTSFGRNAEPHAGRHAVLDNAPAVIFLAGAHRAAERLALLGREDTGLVELVALLERPHRGDRAVAEFRIEAARRDRRTRPGRTGSPAVRRPALRHRPPSGLRVAGGAAGGSVLAPSRAFLAAWAFLPPPCFSLGLRVWGRPAGRRLLPARRRADC